MGMSNTLPSEVAAIVATIDPDAYTNATYLSDAIDMSKFDQIMAVLMAGTLGASATFAAKFTQATTSGGTYKDITNKAITNLTQAVSPDDSDKQAIINCRAEELDVANDYRWAKLSLTIGVAESDAGAVVLGFGERYGPAADGDLASVAEIVN